jgi:Holliday junction DNA helicase RuvA
MIARVSGTVWSVAEKHIVVRVGGIGLTLQVPENIRAQAGNVGQPIELHTYLHVRENGLSLFGFLTEDELELFKLLLGVSGVGPKVALAMLGAMPAVDLREAVVNDNPAVLTSVPGVGSKTAKAVIFHLRDKLAWTGEDAAPLLSDVDREVIAALTSLGFSLVEAQAAVQTLPQDDSQAVEDRVRLALAYFASP